MYKYLSITLFLSVLIVSGCKKKNDDPVPDPPSTGSNAEFAFLEDNNQWTYDYSVFFSEGTMIQTADSIAPNLFRILTSYDGTDADSSYWFVSGSYLKVYQEGETAANAKIIYKANPQLNDEWNNPGNSSNTIYYKIVNMDTAVTTTAGVFKCRKIEVTFSDAFNTQYNYWNDDYGLVYQEGIAALDLTNKNFRKGMNKPYRYLTW